MQDVAALKELFSSLRQQSAIGGVTALTGYVLRYTSPNYGVIRTNNHGDGILSADVVFLCSEHHLVKILS